MAAVAVDRMNAMSALSGQRGSVRRPAGHCGIGRGWGPALPRRDRRSAWR